MARSAVPAHKRWISGTCQTGKRIYADRASGKAAAKRMAKLGHGNMRPYQCPHCGGQWHIGHQQVYRTNH